MKEDRSEKEREEENSCLLVDEKSFCG